MSEFIMAQDKTESLPPRVHPFRVLIHRLLRSPVGTLGVIIVLAVILVARWPRPCWPHTTRPNFNWARGCGPPPGLKVVVGHILWGPIRWDGMSGAGYCMGPASQ